MRYLTRLCGVFLIVIFQSDHGHSVEQRTFGGGGNAGPFRGAKFSLFEGGIHVPAIINWPGQLPAHKVNNQMAPILNGNLTPPTTFLYKEKRQTIWP